MPNDLTGKADLN